MKQSDLTQDGILSLLPVLEKATLQQRSADLLTRSASPELGDGGDLGSTGEPLRVYRSAGALSGKFQTVIPQIAAGPGSAS